MPPDVRTSAPSSISGRALSATDPIVPGQGDTNMHSWKRYYGCRLALCMPVLLAPAQTTQIGREVAIPEHLQNGSKFQISLSTLLQFGKQLFTANWTIQEGQGRPLAKGVGTPTPLSDPASPL